MVDLAPMAARSVMQFQYAMAPSAWGLREVVSYDLPLLWAREYRDVLRRFSVSDRESRGRFLARAGVRFCVVQEPFGPGAKPVHTVAGFDHWSLYDCNRDARRAFMATSVVVEPDDGERVSRLFDARLPADAVVVDEPLDGVSGTLVPASAAPPRIVTDAPHRVVVEATAGPAGGALVLLDTFDPDWAVTVDGQASSSVRGNVLFRTVALPPGSHRVEFEYRPRMLYAGAALSMAGLLVVLLPWMRPRVLTAPAEAPFEFSGRVL